MKNALLVMPLLFVVLFGCSKVDERPANYIDVNGNMYNLSEGYIDDDGTNTEITYRSYDIFLCDKKNYTSCYIFFETMSNSTQRLAEGVYSYSYLYEKGFFTSLAIGYDLEYDSSGEAVRGTRIIESSMSDIDGTITIEQDEGDYRFIFNLSFDYNGKPYVIQGQFWDVLTNDYL